MFCSKCGAEYKDGTLFCPGCGMNLQGNMHMPTQNAENKPTKGKKKWLVAAIVILLAIGGVGTVLWQNGMIGGDSDELDSSISDDITRGYDENSTAKDVLAGEANRLDIQSKIGYTEESDNSYVSTANTEQMDMIVCEGGSAFGIEAERITFYFDDYSTRNLDYLYYCFPKGDYDDVYEAISKKYKKCKRKEGDREFWNTEHYSIYISRNPNNTGVRVTLY